MLIEKTKECYIMLNAKNPQTIRKESSAEYFSSTALQRNLHHIVAIIIVYVFVTVIITVIGIAVPVIIRVIAVIIVFAVVFVIRIICYGVCRSAFTVIFKNRIFFRLYRSAAMRAGITAADRISATAICAGRLLICNCIIYRLSRSNIKRSLFCALVLVSVRSEEYHKERMNADKHKNEYGKHKRFTVKSCIHYSRRQRFKAFFNRFTYIAVVS